MSAVHVLANPPKIGFESSHSLHDGSQDWPEKNCSIDLWIEVLHALKVEPLAALGNTVSTDFEGDQWTFYKVAPGDVMNLFGVDTQELTIWKPVLEHLREQLPRKRLVLLEADSFNLPDTKATDYQTNHVKTTIAVEGLDEAAGKLNYFHSAGYWELGGEDFQTLFVKQGINQGANLTGLPPFTEYLKTDHLVIRPRTELVAMAKDILKRELSRRPKQNPLSAFRARFVSDLDWIAERDLGAFHNYAFAVVRQMGVSFALASAHLKWIDDKEPGHVQAAEHFDSISKGAKTLLFKLARMANNKKKPNVDETFAAMESSWAAGMETIAARYGA